MTFLAVPIKSRVPTSGPQNGTGSVPWRGANRYPNPVSVSVRYQFWSRTTSGTASDTVSGAGLGYQLGDRFQGPLHTIWGLWTCDYTNSQNVKKWRRVFNQTSIWDNLEVRKYWHIPDQIPDLLLRISFLFRQTLDPVTLCAVAQVFVSSVFQVLCFSKLRTHLTFRFHVLRRVHNPAASPRNHSLSVCCSHSWFQQKYSFFHH